MPQSKEIIQEEQFIQSHVKSASFLFDECINELLATAQRKGLSITREDINKLIWENI